MVTQAARPTLTAAISAVDGNAERRPEAGAARDPPAEAVAQLEPGRGQAPRSRPR